MTTATVQRASLHQLIEQLSEKHIVELAHFVNSLLSKEQHPNRSSNNWSDTDLRRYSALMLFQLKKISSGTAADMAGMSRIAFLDLCAEYNISISQISPEDLEKEMIDA